MDNQCCWILNQYKSSWWSTIKYTKTFFLDSNTLIQYRFNCWTHLSTWLLPILCGPSSQSSLTTGQWWNWVFIGCLIKGFKREYNRCMIVYWGEIPIFSSSSKNYKISGWFVWMGIMVKKGGIIPNSYEDIWSHFRFVTHYPLVI